MRRKVQLTTAFAVLCILVDYYHLMIHPHIEPYLPSDVFMALQAVTRHIESLPISADSKMFYQKDVENLTARLVAASKQHDLEYPNGELNG